MPFANHPMPRPAARITRAAASRLRRLVEKRLAALEALTAQAGKADSAIELERQGKALIALMKALEAALAMEGRARAKEAGQGRAKADDDAACARLARRLEALLAPVSAPRPVGETERS